MAQITVTFWSPTTIDHSQGDYSLFPGGSGWHFQNAFSILFFWLVTSDPPWQCLHINITGSYSRWDNIATANGLVPSRATKPLRPTLPGPMLIQIYVAIWPYWQDELISVIMKMHNLRLLTQWGRDKMTAIFNTTCSLGFSWIKYISILIKISLMFPPKSPIYNYQHWFR